MVDYTSTKATLLGQNHPEVEFSESSKGEVNGLSAMFFQGSGTVLSNDVDVLCMTVEGKTHFYLLFGLVSKGSPAKAKNDLLGVMKTFREKK